MEKEVSEVDRKLSLKKTYLDRINRYISSSEMGQDELYSFVRKFFYEYLKLDYEFTYEELSFELNKVLIQPKVKDHIDDFLIRLSESEYLEENSLQPSDINSFLNELSGIITEIIYDDKSSSEDGVLVKKLWGSKHKDKDKDAEDLVQDVKLLIDDVNFHLSKGNIDSAKKSYVDLLKAYDKLSKNAKEPLHKEVSGIYDRLQASIKNPSNKIDTGAIASSQPDIVSSDTIPNTASSIAPIQSSESAHVDAYLPSDVYTAAMVKGLIDKTSSCVDSGNLDSANKSYATALRAYESLGTEDKKSLYDSIDGLYLKIQDLSISSKKISTASSKQPETQSSASTPIILETDSNTLFGQGLQSTQKQETNKKDTVASSKSEYTVENAGETVPENNNVLFTMNGSEIDSDKINSGIINSDSTAKSTPAIKTPLATPAIIESSSTISSPSSNQEIDKKNIVGDVKVTKGEKIIGRKIPSSKKTVSDASSNKDVSSNNILPTASVNTILSGNSDYTNTYASSAYSFDALLKNIDDSISSENFDDAKMSYSEALKIYKSMDTSEKIRSYDALNILFRKLDEAMHKKSLHKLLDEHSIDAHETEDSHHPASSIHPKKHKPHSSNTSNVLSTNISNNFPNTFSNNLPVALSNDDESSKVYGLIEESYINISRGKTDAAMLKYFKALELYHKLSVDDKKKMYAGLYELFKKLSDSKKR